MSAANTKNPNKVNSHDQKAPRTLGKNLSRDHRNGSVKSADSDTPRKKVATKFGWSGKGGLSSSKKDLKVVKRLNNFASAFDTRPFDLDDIQKKIVTSIIGDFHGASTREEMGQMLAQIRTALNKRQQDVADAMGVNVRAVKRIENAETNTTFESAAQYAAVLGLDLGFRLEP